MLTNWDIHNTVNRRIHQYNHIRQITTLIFSTTWFHKTLCKHCLVFLTSGSVVDFYPRCNAPNDPVLVCCMMALHNAKCENFRQAVNLNFRHFRSRKDASHNSLFLSRKFGPPHLMTVVSSEIVFNLFSFLRKWRRCLYTFHYSFHHFNDNDICAFQLGCRSPIWWLKVGISDPQNRRGFETKQVFFALIFFMYACIL